MADQSATPSNARFEQTFPTLSGQDIERIRRFGETRDFAGGGRIIETGREGPGMVVILSGHIVVTQRDGLGHVTPIVDHGPGQFLGEVGQLFGRASLVDAHADGDVEAIVIPPQRLRELLVAEAELGERITRALILRRVGLIQSDGGGPLIIGAPTSGDVARLQSFLARNGYPHHALDPATDTEAAALVAASPACMGGLPWVVIADGSVLYNPGEVELARAIGMVSSTPAATEYDVAIVGAGPSGLATAVYAASEGLSVVVMDTRAYGGQAGASARIENYLGFPTGISGAALAGRAFVQAQKFGAEMMIPSRVGTMDCSRSDGYFGLELEGGARVRARSVVIASGARYRKIDVPDLHAYEGKGIWYWASPIEAKLVAGSEVIVVGGGNSAGQAAVFLSGVASRVHVLIRGNGLAETMSRYLVDRLTATPNIELHSRTDVKQLIGDAEQGLRAVIWRNRDSGQETQADIGHLFLFVGAEPATDWLAGCGVEVDRLGFVASPAANGSASSHLETTIPGVFAVGDVRSGSIKRVGAAIGEGAQVVAALHAYLSGARQSTA